MHRVLNYVKLLIILIKNVKNLIEQKYMSKKNCWGRNLFLRAADENIRVEYPRMSSDFQKYKAEEEQGSGGCPPEGLQISAPGIKVVERKGGEKRKV